MKICCVSDLHGYLIPIPECDLLIIAGDICPVYNHSIDYQAEWLGTVFKKWLGSVPAKHIVGVAGNHDLVFQFAPSIVPSLPWVYLQDKHIDIDGCLIHGTPWQLKFGENWAFNTDESGIDWLCSSIPENCNIIVSHGPPYRYGDLAPRGCNDFEHVGSVALAHRMKSFPNLRYLVCGHIHSASGTFKVNEQLTVINASILNEQYKPVFQPKIFEINREEYVS
jgi:Icc-related predicted phosphoesterase